MPYLSDATGVLSGVLPAPHGGVRIAMGEINARSIFVTYEGTRAELLACGAIDGYMAEDLTTDARDARLRPYQMTLLVDGNLRITRILASIDKAADLPGIGGPRPIHAGTPKPRRANLRLVIRDPGRS